MVRFTVPKYLWVNNLPNKSLPATGGFAEPTITQVRMRLAGLGATILLHVLRHGEAAAADANPPLKRPASITAR